MRRPVLTGEVVGRRGWALDDSLGEVRRLRSSWAKREWLPGENTAHCVWHPEHRAPRHSCHCGLYAVYAPETVKQFMSGRLEMGLAIVGLVTGWGNIEVHMDGFRAEHARVAALVDDPKLPPGQAKRLAEIYKVPLIGWDEWLDDDFIREFGDPVPLEVRPMRPGRRTWRGLSHRQLGVAAIYALVLVGAAGMVATQSVWPVLGVTWVVTAMTFTAMWWPEWWDR